MGLIILFNVSHHLLIQKKNAKIYLLSLKTEKWQHNRQCEIKYKKLHASYFNSVSFLKYRIKTDKSNSTFTTKNPTTDVFHV